MTESNQTGIKADSPTPNSQLPTPARRHVLDLDDFTRDEIGEILETTTSMKEVLGRAIPQAPVLRGTELGRLEMSGEGVPAMSIPLYAGMDVPMLGFLPRILGGVRTLVLGS